MTHAVEIELVGGPLDGERRAIPVASVNAPLVFVGSPEPRLTTPGEWYDIGLPRFEYRSRLTREELDLLGPVEGMRFDFQRYDGRRESVSA